MKNLLKNNYLFFYYLKRKHYKRYKSTYNTDRIYSELVNYGFSVIPNYYSKNTCNEILFSMESHLDDIFHNQYSLTKHHFIPDFGVYLS